MTGDATVELRAGELPPRGIDYLLVTKSADRSTVTGVTNHKNTAASDGEVESLLLSTPRFDNALAWAKEFAQRQGIAVVYTKTDA